MFLRKLKTEPADDAAISPLDIYPKKRTLAHGEDICTPMFTAASFKQPNAHEWMDKWRKKRRDR